ncbi:MAG: PhoH family protein [Lachnospiraceae bacterium]|nr:PhoH family protein [Lachnospiraceae bacterium]
MQNVIETSIHIPLQYLGTVLGQFDRNSKKIERAFKTEIIPREDRILIRGGAAAAARTERILNELARLAAAGSEINDQQVNYILSLAEDGKEEIMIELEQDVIATTVGGKLIKPKTVGQKKYVDTIAKKMLVFGLGPAGTGKTYLAMAMAIEAFRRQEVNRIILTRPAIEAGEKLGFLPGDLQSKVDPYLRPLYDALYQIMGAEAFLKNTEKGLIEVAPLAYMRGRTLDQAFIILDEAQNTTPAQMKMFLTRIGFGSKVVVTGDESQKDLPPGTVSGLDVAKKVLAGIEDIGFCEFTNKDVVRHPLVQKIVHAYEKFESNEKYRESRRERRVLTVRGKKHEV